MLGRIKQAALPLAARLARWSGVDVIPRDYHSPVPDSLALTGEEWDRRSPLAGLTFDSAAHLDYAETELAAHMAEFDPPREPRADRLFHLQNTWYQSVDAEVLYAIVRRHRPARVVELGSGWSTLVICEALAANEREGVPRASYEVHDPHWGPPVREGIPQIGSIDRVRGQDVPDAAFAALRAGDVLFVDTSHIVKLGSEVNRVVLEILPSLAEGVLVHFHDVWLPYEYHRMLIQGMGLAWNEQYLIQAFLAENERWEILFACQAAVREQPERVRGLIPSYDGTTHPSALWLRRR